MIKCIARIDRQELQELLEAEFEGSSIEILDIEFDKYKKEVLVHFRRT